MKKIFHLQQENKHPDRVIDTIKHELRRYLKRERKKKLPDDAAFWDFDCRFGQNSDEAESLFVSEVIAALDKAHEASWKQCYVEIIAKPVSKKDQAEGKIDSEQDESIIS